MKSINLSFVVASLVSLAFASPIEVEEIFARGKFGPKVVTVASAGAACLSCQWDDCNPAHITTFPVGSSSVASCWAPGKSDEWEWGPAADPEDTSYPTQTKEMVPGSWAFFQEQGCYVDGNNLSKGWKKGTPECSK